MTMENYALTFFLLQPLNTLLVCSLTERISTLIETGKGASSMDESSALLCGTCGRSGEVKMLTPNLNSHTLPTQRLAFCSYCNTLAIQKTSQRNGMTDRERDAVEVLIDYEFNAFDRWNAASWIFKGYMTKEEALEKLRVCVVCEIS